LSFVFEKRQSVGKVATGPFWSAAIHRRFVAALPSNAIVSGKKENHTLVARGGRLT
jgi:hypothetical protein